MSSVPKVCSFRGARELVMQRVWSKSRLLEQKGIPVTHDMFGRLIKEEWKVVKEEAARVCPIVSFEEIQKILGEYKAEGVVESEKIEGAAKPVEAKVAVSLKAQRLEE